MFSEEAVAKLDNFTLENGKPATFRRLLLNQCQEEFEKDKKLQVVPDEVKATMDIDDLDQLNIRERKAKNHVFGNMIFIGELFKEKVAPPPPKAVFLCLTVYVLLPPYKAPCNNKTG
jgi:hypothetical protein